MCYKMLESDEPDVMNPTLTDAPAPHDPITNPNPEPNQTVGEKLFLGGVLFFDVDEKILEVE